MIEIQSHHLAIGFQLVGTMPSFEQAGGSKARKLCFQGAGSFFVTGSQGSAVSVISCIQRRVRIRIMISSRVKDCDVDR